MPDCQLSKSFFKYKCNLLRIVISNLLYNPKGILMYLKELDDVIITTQNIAIAVFRKNLIFNVYFSLITMLRSTSAQEHS